MIPLARAEKREFGYTEVAVPAGTKVKLSPGSYALITAEGLACDCGKGVLCPLNPQLSL